MDELEMARHRKMMANRAEWPNWPILPIKRRVEDQNWPEVATLYASDPLEFFDVSMYSLQEAIADGKKGVPVTPQELVNKGWVVD